MNDLQPSGRELELRRAQDELQRTRLDALSLYVSRPTSGPGLLSDVLNAEPADG